MIKTKYNNLVLERNLAATTENAKLLVDILYQFAFTLVQSYLKKQVVD